MTITALHREPDRAANAIDAAFRAIDRVEEVMSLYRPASELCRLNRDGRLRDPAPELVEVLELAQQLSARSSGKFDVTVQPLWKLHDACAKAGRTPTEAELKSTRRLVDWRHVEVSPREIRFGGAGMAITLNGIAQGYAADQALKALQAGGIEHALVNAGELGSLGRSPRGDRWGIGIEHPRVADAYVALADLDGRCLATSGDYRSTFSGDRERHHLLDPETGQSACGFASVSIVAPSGLLADALSTAVFVLGVERGEKLIARTPGADMFCVLSDGGTRATPGFPLRSEEASA